jgi:hypothetical protein
MPEEPTKPTVINSRPTSLPSTTQTGSTQPAPSPKQVNAFAVNHLSARAHPSRPQPGISDGKLPANYNKLARKYTSVMVALPIALVTSYVLWDRREFGETMRSVGANRVTVVLGHEQKKLVGDTPDPSIPQALDLPGEGKA